MGLYLLVFSLFFSTISPEYQKIRSNNMNFTDHSTAYRIQLFVAVKGIFLVYSFSEQVTANVISPETA